MYKKKCILVFMMFLFSLNPVYSMTKIKQIDGLSFNFKIQFDSVVKSKKDEYIFDFKKSKLGFFYELNDKFNFVVTFLYDRRNNFEFDQEYLKYSINERSFIYFGNIRTIFDMYFEKSEEQLSIVIPIINKATGFFVKTKGLGFIYKNNFNDNFSFHLSAVGKNVNNSNDDSGVLTLRTFYFHKNEDNVLHIGFNDSFIYNNKKRKDSKVSDNIYHDFSIKKLNSIGLEFASLLKNFTVESEIFYVKMNPFVEALSKKYFNAYNFYAEINYILTGEIKQYDKVSGVIKKFKVKRPIGENGVGAFETVIRYQFTNAIANKHGYGIDMGKHNILLLGFNWLPTNYSKILLNYSRIKSHYKIKGDKNNSEIKLEYRFFI